jgi:hypothetical protein
MRKYIGHLYKSAGSTDYNKFDAWINPTALEMNTLSGADASFSANSGIASFNTIGFRTANLDNGVSVRIDEPADLDRSRTRLDRLARTLPARHGRRPAKLSAR